MRIGLFCYNYPPSPRQGGIEDYAERLTTALVNKGVEVTVVANGPEQESGSDERLQILRSPEPWDRRWARRWRDELNSRAVDLILLQYSPAMFDSPQHLAWPLLSSTFPSVVAFHTLWGGPKRNYITAWRLLRAADAIIATNSEILYLLERHLPWHLERTVFIPIGANITPDSLEADRDIADQYGISNEKLVLSYFGMTYPGKGMKNLFETASILKKKLDIEFQLLCIGGGISDDGSYRAARRQMVAEAELEQEIRWTGRIPASHVSALLAASDIVVLPYTSGVSDRRGSLMAALAHGKPVVTTPPRIPISHFVNGKHMLWPETHSPDGLARAIKSIRDDSALRATLETGALELSSRLGWEQIATDTERLFARTLDARTT